MYRLTVPPLLSPLARCCALWALSVLLLAFVAVWPARAQDVATPAQAAAPALAEEDEEEDDWRDVSDYPFPAVSATVEAMQFVAYAMQLREYCADARIADAFVRDRLARFSQLTGREEDCASLLDY